MAAIGQEPGCEMRGFVARPIELRELRRRTARGSYPKQRRRDPPEDNDVVLVPGTGPRTESTGCGLCISDRDCRTTGSHIEFLEFPFREKGQAPAVGCPERRPRHPICGHY